MSKSLYRILLILIVVFVVSGCQSGGFLGVFGPAATPTTDWDLMFEQLGTSQPVAEDSEDNNGQGNPDPSQPTATPMPNGSNSASSGAGSVNTVWFYKPPENGPLSTVADNFDMFILTHRDEEERDEMRALGVDEPFYQYLLFVQIMDPESCTDRPFGNQVAYKPGDFCQLLAEHPDWFLRDTNGNLIRRGDNVFMDPGNDGYRAFWVERAKEMQDQFGWDGIFIDNVEGSLAKIYREGVEPANYRDDASYQQAIEGFLLYLKANYFQPENKPVLANIIELRDVSVWYRYMEHLDGAMIESFATDYDGYYSANDWAFQMEVIQETLEAGKTLVLVTQGDEGDRDRQEFALGSYLLINNGNAYFRYTNSDYYNQIWLYNNYNIALGAPLGPAYQTGSVWQRDFERGYVIVDPDRHIAEIRVNQ